MKKNLLITFHPVTLLEKKDSENEINQLLKSMSLLEETLQIFTMPNADPGNDYIFKAIETYVKNNKFAFLFSSLGQLKYYSCLKQVDALVGNSSSGILKLLHSILVQLILEIGRKVDLKQEVLYL